jgi:hypothetical protein
MARTLALLLLAFTAFALIAVACGNEGDFLLDEEPEATGTPPFFQRTPQPSPTPSPVGSPPAAGATPVTPFQITTDTTVNKRSEPSTAGGQETVAGSLTPDDTATVIAQIPGEAVEADNDIWYQLDDGSFVYSGAVNKVEEEQAGTEEGQQ